MTLIEEFKAFCAGVMEGTGLILLPTDSSIVGQTHFPLDQLTRLENIVVQKNGNDGGDSAHRTGILAFCGNRQDQDILGLFEHGGIMVRNPYQEPWNNPDNCSRDQLLAFAAGCWRAGRTDIVGRLLKQTEDRHNTCQNIDNDYKGTRKEPPIGDPILPHEHMFLKVCAGQPDAQWDLVGQWLLQVTIESVKHLPKNAEINQLVLECIVCCRLDHFAKHVPDYEERIHTYWNNPGTQQSQIGDALIAVIKTELERYDGFLGLAFPPIPAASILNIIEKLATAVDEISKGHLPHILNPLELKRFLEDVKDTFDALIADCKANIEYYTDLAPTLFKIATQLQSILPFGAVNPLGFLGSSNQQDMDEIKQALSEVSRQLKEIIEFLKRDLGPVVRQATLEAMSTVLEIQAGLEFVNQVQPLIQTVERARDKAIRNTALWQLQENAGNVVVSGCGAVKLFPSAAIPVVETFVGVVAAGSCLLRHDTKTFGPSVSAWASSIIDALNEALVGKGGTKDKPALMSLEYISSQLPKRSEALDAAKLIPPHQGSIAVYWGLQRTYHPARTHGSPRHDGIDVPASWSAIAYGALLHNFNLDYGEWQIDDSPRVREMGLSSCPPADYPFLPRPPDNNYTLQSWWPLTVDFGGPWEDRGRDMKAKANQIASRSRKLAARLAIDSQIAMVRDVIQQAEELRSAVNTAVDRQRYQLTPQWAVNYMQQTKVLSAEANPDPQQAQSRRRNVLRQGQ